MTLMDDFDLDNMELEEEPQPEDSGNRTFVLVAAILGGILLVSLRLQRLTLKTLRLPC